MKNDLSLHLDQEYLLFLRTVEERLSIAQLRAMQAVNIEVIQFYWYLGKNILERQSLKKNWGNRLIEQLSHDLQTLNKGMAGFSKRSLEYMRLLASIYPDEREFMEKSISQLPWSHIQLLLDKFKDDYLRREWYANEALMHGWSRSTLNSQIKILLYERQSSVAQKVSNYQKMLPAPNSDLAHDMLKNPYNFDFLTLSRDAQEREIEKGLVNHIKEFLLELGAGFSFVGTQVPLEIDGDEFFLDILFYHLKLRSYVVVEIKATKFKPSHLGQLSFYLAAVDSHLRQPQDNPTIGILLCESRSKIIAEYALKNINAPIGVSEYTLSKALPKEFTSSLPTIEEIETELNEANKGNN